MALKLTKTHENEATSSNEIAALDFNQVQLIALEDIDVSDRLREVDSDYAVAIAGSIEKSGLLQPIDICQMPNQKSGKPYRLVAGGHRIEAYRLLGHASIEAFIRSNAADARREREIHENLFKTDLKPFDRAKFVGELYEIEKRKSGLEASDDGRKAGANVRWQIDGREFKDELKNANETISFAYGFTDRVAEKIGLTTRTIQNDLSLLRIPPSLIERLKGNPILENAGALKRLAKLSPERREFVVDHIEVGNTFKVAFDLAEGKLDPLTPAQKREAAFLKAFRALGPREAIAALGLIKDELPKGISIDFGGAK